MAKPEKKSTPIKGGRGGKRAGAGRKKGVPNKVTVELATAAKVYAPEALKTLHTICTSGSSESARVAAAQALLDRAFGKPRQAIEHSGTPGAPIKHDVRLMSAKRFEEIARKVCNEF